MSPKSFFVSSQFTSPGILVDFKQENDVLKVVLFCVHHKIYRNMYFTLGRSEIHFRRWRGKASRISDKFVCLIFTKYGPAQKCSKCLRNISYK